MDKECNNSKTDIKSSWKNLKNILSIYLKTDKNLSLEEYLRELSAYTDKLIVELENEEQKYIKGYCTFHLMDDIGKIKIIINMFFEDRNKMIVKKELQRDISKNIFKKEVINSLKLENKHFEIQKG